MTAYINDFGWIEIMRSCTGFILWIFTIVVMVGCSSSSVVGEAEMSRGEKSSRVGISNMGEGPEVYGSIRMGGSFR
ncbi:hypothetical protein [Wohlfahrtiimonas larvae]|uniref:Uncharacterized protein n=1 Tax=Wohlfahrtiimonas larvae TaxID=1157986 RepID=A0ABP9MES4_9GAMM|nr:hypothetical protein [Wohlfahrtiimonas larvae]